MCQHFKRYICIDHLKDILAYECYSYVDSSGVGGEIPSTFANLRNMQIL
jgi:hypothetical protein